MRFKYSFLLAISLVILLITSCRQDNKVEDVQETIKDDDQLLLLNKSIEADPNSAELYQKRSKYYFEKNEYQKSFRDIQNAMDLDPDNSNHYIILSELYFSTNKIDEAKKALIRAVQIDPDNDRVLLKMGEQSLYLKNYDDADNYLKRSITLNKSNPKAYFLLGFSAKERNDTSNAILAFQKCLEADENFYDACIQLGILYDAQRNSLAADYYSRAIEIQPNNTEARYNLAMHYQNMLDYNRAIETYTDLLDIDANFKYAHFNLGFIHIETQAYSEAKKHFNNAVIADPEYAEGYYGRAYCNEVLGDVINAEIDYKKALSLKTNYQAAIEGLNRVQQILKR